MFVPFGCHVCVPLKEHKHGVSIQSSINLSDTLLQITREWKTAETWFVARLFIYQSSIVSQTRDVFHWMVTIFILITWLVKTDYEKRTTQEKFRGKRFQKLAMRIGLMRYLLSCTRRGRRLKFCRHCFHDAFAVRSGININISTRSVSRQLSRRFPSRLRVGFFVVCVYC